MTLRDEVIGIKKRIEILQAENRRMIEEARRLSDRVERIMAKLESEDDRPETGSSTPSS